MSSTSAPISNIQSPVEVRGDILSVVGANDAGVGRLFAIMAEFGLTDIDDLAAPILERSHRAAISAIPALSHGVCRAELTLNGDEAAIELTAAMTVGPAGLNVDCGRS